MKFIEVDDGNSTVMINLSLVEAITRNDHGFTTVHFSGGEIHLKKDYENMKKFLDKALQKD